MEKRKRDKEQIRREDESDREACQYYAHIPLFEVRVIGQKLRFLHDFRLALFRCRLPKLLRPRFPLSLQLFLVAMSTQADTCKSGHARGSVSQCKKKAAILSNE